jgi:predicted 3-demethylubiquinone-9 3-methyltransferase (glyoxalase superfamily)
MMRDSGAEKSDRMVQALLQMKKIDISTIQNIYVNG